MEHVKTLLLGAAIMLMIALITMHSYGMMALTIVALLALSYGLGIIVKLLWSDFSSKKKKDTRVELHEHV